MKRLTIAMLCCLALAATLALAQGEEGFQTATVNSIEKLANDARHPSDLDHYKISMRMGDVLYMCKAAAPAATFMDWIGGKEFPAKENGKVLQVKNRDGKIIELEITGKKKPK